MSLAIKVIPVVSLYFPFLVNQVSIWDPNHKTGQPQRRNYKWILYTDSEIRGLKLPHEMVGSLKAPLVS